MRALLSCLYGVILFILAKIAAYVALEYKEASATENFLKVIPQNFLDLWIYPVLFGIAGALLMAHAIKKGF